MPPRVEAEPLRVSCNDPAQRAWAEGLNRIRIRGAATNGGQVASKLVVQLGGVSVQVRLERGMTPRQSALALAAALPKSVRCDVLGDSELPQSEAVLVLAAPGQAVKVDVFANDPVQHFILRDANTFVIRGCVDPENPRLSFVVLTLDQDTVKLKLTQMDSPRETARKLLAALPVRYRKSLVFNDSQVEHGPVRVVIVT